MLPNLSQLSPAAVRNNLEILKQYIREAEPGLNVERGKFHDLVLTYAAAFTTANQQEITAVLSANNIGQLVRNPDATDRTYVDAVMANYGIYRKASAPSQGSVVFVSTEHVGMTIPPHTMLHANGHSFETTEPVQAKTQNAVDNQRLMLPYGKNEWSFNVPVKSLTVGAETNLRQGTQLQFDRAVFKHIKTVYVASELTGGADEETNAQLVNRYIHQHITAKVLSNRLTYETLIMQHPDHERTHVSIIGFGDPEMHRDNGKGGCVDIYIRQADAVPGSKRSYEIAAELEEFVKQNNVSSITNDVRVFSAVPLEIKTNIKLIQLTSNRAINTAAMTAAIVSAINSTGFIGQLSTTLVLQAIQYFLDSGVVVKEITLTDAQQLTTTLLTATSPRTCVFYQDPQNVTINILS